MIVIRLMGGLGNQLFQYAAGRQLAERLGTQLFLDLGWFGESHPEDTRREFDLGQFRIRAGVADAELLQNFGGPDFSFFGRLKTEIVSVHQFHKAKFYEYGYDPDIREIEDNTYLKGYFQSEKYFWDISDQLREELIFRNEEEYRKHPLYDTIRSSPSVALHVRRGDYTGDTTHGICDREYYSQAIAFLQERRGSEITVFVFSDEPSRVSQELDLPGAVFVDNSAQPFPHIDLFLMSNCRHQVIANSSYSWWAAWLNPSPEKMVVAPVKWTREHRTAAIDLEMAGMHLIG